MRARLRSVAAAACLLVLVSPDAAGAQTSGELLDDGAQASAKYNRFSPGTGGQPVAPSGSNTNRECWIEYAAGGSGDVERVSLEVLQEAYGNLQAGGGGKLPIEWVCQDIGGGNPASNSGDWPPDDNTDFLLSPQFLRDQALARLWFPPPVGDMSPGLGSGTFAQLPTYYWVTNTEPQPEATATAGPVWARVWAEAIRQDWVIQDDLRGNYSFGCDGPGVSYNPASGGAPPAGSCVWPPAHSSAGQSATHPETGQPCFPATVTITWQVWWESNAVDGGSLGTGQSAASACIVVHEIQAVVTDG